MIAVGLRRVGIVRTIIANVADAVAIRICLIGICVIGAVVGIVRFTVEVDVQHTVGTAINLGTVGGYPHGERVDPIQKVDRSRNIELVRYAVVIDVRTV